MDEKTLISILYVLVFFWLISQIRNDLLVKKLNCEEYYINIRENIKKQKSSKYLLKLIIVSLSIFFLCLVPGFGVALFVAVSSFFSGEDPFRPFNIYSSLSTYAGSIVFIIIYMVFIRGIYINIISINELKKGDILDIKDIKKETGNPPEP